MAQTVPSTSFVPLGPGRIAEKFAAVGGASALGGPVGAPGKLSDGRTEWQPMSQGIIFNNAAYGAYLASLPISQKWQSLATEANAQGDSVQDYLGAAVGDSFSLAGGGEAQYYERGMIVARADKRAFVVYGGIYLKYRDLGDVKSVLGLPVSDEQPSANGGRCSLFDNGDIYWTSASGAHEIHGAIRQRWLAIGGAGSAPGYPTSDESAVLNKGQQVGRFNTMQNGAIYWTPSTGAFEVYGAIFALWTQSYGGPNGPLGFPLSGETDTPDAGGRYNDFQNGIIVWHGGGPYAGAFAFGNLVLFIDHFESDWGSFHVQVNVSAANPASAPAALADTWFPSPSDYAHNPVVEKSVTVVPTLNHATTVSLWMDGLGTHKPETDDVLGQFQKQYDITNLWGTQLSTPDGNPTHPANQAQDTNHHINFIFSFQSDFPLPPGVPFRQQLFWPYHNFSTAKLSNAQFAQTYSDIGEDEQWYLHPFDALFYLVYEGMAGSGTCFGMCLEALYARHDRSVFPEPIYNDPSIGYPAALQTGSDPDPNNAADAVFTGPPTIKHGYQLGASLLDFFVGKFLGGRTHDPKAVFQEANASFNAGDFPLLCLTKDSLGGGGHVILPYAFNSSGPVWTISVANPNDPASLIPNDSDPSSVLPINANTNSWSFPMSVMWSGGNGTGGRLFSVPFSVVNSEPRSPFWEVFALLAGGVIALCCDGAQTVQVTDGAGRTFYRYTAVPGMLGRYSKDIESDGTKLIPDMVLAPQINAPVAVSSDVLQRAGTPNQPAPPEVYYLRRSPAFTKPPAAPVTTPAPAPAIKARTITSQAAGPVLEVQQGVNIGEVFHVSDETKDLQLSWEINANGGSSYRWALRSAAGSIVATIPGSAATDIVQIQSIARAGQMVTLSVSAGGAPKTAALTLVASSATASPLRSFALTGVPMGVGSGIGALLDNGGQELVIQNPGAQAVVGLTIQSGTNGANAAARPSVTIPAGAVVKILPSDWTAANIAKAPVIVQHLDRVGGNVVSQTQI